MGLIQFLIVMISGVGVIWAQEKAVVEINFKIREERIPAIINYVLNNSLEKHDIKTEDIIKLSKLDQYNLEETLGVVGYFNKSTQEVFNVDNLETALKSMNVPFQEFYNALISSLQLSNAQIQNILNDLEIPFIDFLMALPKTDDSEIYAALKKGVYDETHVNAAFERSQKKQNEVYTTARSIILEKAYQLSSTDFMGILKSHGWDKRTTLSLYSALNLTTRDVYEVEKFRIIFTNISDSVNQNVTLGVFVGEKNLAIHQDAYDDFTSKVDGVTFKAEADGVEVSVSKSRNLGERIVELMAEKSRDNFITVVDTYSNNVTSDNCYYLTIDTTAYKVEVDFEELSISKLESFEFRLGSPLVCDSLLYGLASREDSSRIFFDRFYTEDYPEDDREENDILIDEGRSLSPTILILTFNLLIILTLL